MLHWLLGASLLFPSVGIGRVGISVLLLIPIIFIEAIKGRLKLNATKYFFLYVSYLFLNTFVVFIFDKDVFILKMAVLYFGLGLFFYYGMVISIDHNARSMFIRGYMVSARFVAFFSILQFVSWNLLNFDSVFIHGVHNISLHTEQVDVQESLISYGRAFAFSFEPSINALLLSVAFFRSLKLGGNSDRVIFLLALISTQSISAYISVILVFLFYIFSIANFKFIFYVICSSLIIVYLSYFYFEFVLRYIESLGIDNPLVRFVNIFLGQDGSSLSRSNSIFNAFDLILERPFFGWGVYSEYVISYLIGYSLDIEVNAGINSFIVNFAVQFGLPLALYLLYNIVIGLYANVKYGFKETLFPEISAAVLLTLVTVSLIHTYAIWIFIGMAFYSSRTIIFESK